MRLHSSTALALSLMLCACSADGANQAGNATAPQGNAAAPAVPGTANERLPQQQPEPSEEITLSVSPEQTTENSTVTLTLRNGSEEQLGYNLCTSALETAAGREVPTSRVCTMELRTLEPERTATYRYELPVNVAQGSYRFAAQVNWMASNRTSLVRSDAFEVRSD